MYIVHWACTCSITWNIHVYRVTVRRDGEGVDRAAVRESKVFWWGGGGGHAAAPWWEDVCSGVDSRVSIWIRHATNKMKNPNDACKWYITNKSKTHRIPTTITLRHVPYTCTCTTTLWLIWPPCIICIAKSHVLVVFVATIKQRHATSFLSLVLENMQKYCEPLWMFTMSFYT